MKNLINIRTKILLLLTFVLLINIPGFAQKKKKVTPRKTVAAKKVVKVVNQIKRRAAVYLKDGNVAVGTFVKASAEGIQILITENKLFVKWKDIQQIIFMDDPVEYAPTKDQIPDGPLGEPIKTEEINRKPFEDLADEINSMREKNEIDLSKNFEVVLEGAINADGKLDPKKSKFIKSDGDEEMVRSAKDALIAMGDSGFLGYLREKGIERFNLTLAQNENEIYAILLADLKTPERAATTASAFKTLFQGAIFADNNGMKKLQDISKVLFNNSQITSEGRNFRLDFKLSKQDALDFIKKALDRRAAKKTNSQ